MYIHDKEGVMTTFQLTKADCRTTQYPFAVDQNFLGYDRDLDRWRVEASGIKLYASGVSVELDKDNDSVSIWSASGTEVIPIYASDPIPVSIVDDPYLYIY